MANSDGDAIAVIRSHVVEHAGRLLRLDTSQHDGPFFKFVDRSGLSVFVTVTTMRLDELPVPAECRDDFPKIYALASQALA